MNGQGNEPTGAGPDRRRLLWFSGLGALGAAGAGSAAVMLDFDDPKLPSPHRVLRARISVLG